MTLLKDLSETSKIMLKWVVILIFASCLLGAGVLMIIKHTDIIFQYAAGVLLGGVFSALKLVLMEKSINKSTEMQSARSSGYAAAQYILRYFLTIGVLVFAMFMKNIFNFFGVIIGILLLQFSAYFATYEIKKKDKNKQAEKMR